MCLLWDAYIENIFSLYRIVHRRDLCFRNRKCACFLVRNGASLWYQWHAGFMGVPVFQGENIPQQAPGLR